MAVVAGSVNDGVLIAAKFAEPSCSLREAAQSGIGLMGNVTQGSPHPGRATAGLNAFTPLG